MGDAIAIRQNITPSNMTIEEILLELQKYGYPNLICMTDGEWCCDVNMRTGVKGADFKIRSEFNHKTMRTAVELCYDRVIKALETIENRKEL